MNKIKIELEILQIIGKILKVSYLKIKLKNKLNDIKNWDSINNLKIFLEIEKKFKIQIDENYFFKELTISSIIKIVEKKIKLKKK